jgi:putative acetyltransferase
VSDLVIAVDDPRADDVQALLERHLAFARSHTPPQDVHALDVVGLMSPAITLFSARRARQLLGVGALRHIDATHGEVKSMHTRDVARGQGVARSLLERVIDVARRRGYQRVSLETGAGDAGTVALRTRRLHPMRPVRHLRAQPEQRVHDAPARVRRPALSPRDSMVAWPRICSTNVRSPTCRS